MNIWKNIISPSDTRANEKITEIAELLERETAGVTHSGLYNGRAGISLFFLYLWKYTGDTRYKTLCSNMILQCMNDITQTEMSSAYATGFTGIAWAALLHNNEQTIELDPDLLFADLDEYASRIALAQLNVHLYDFMHGGLGAGIYFLNREKTSAVKDSLDSLFEALAVKATYTENDAAWHCGNFNRLVEDSDVPEYNLGLSHGAPAIIYFLTMLSKVSNRDVQPLLNKSVSWLLKSKFPAGHLSVFPERLIDSMRFPKYSRLAWCYGDLGVLTSLYIAGEATKTGAWMDEAISIAKKTASRRNLYENFVTDAGFCHGASGIAHIFNRLYNYTGLNELANASAYWFDVLLSQTELEKKMHNRHSLLEGYAGVGLSLLAAIDRREPRWDKCFLLS